MKRSHVESQDCALSGSRTMQCDGFASKNELATNFENFARVFFLITCFALHQLTHTLSTDLLQTGRTPLKCTLTFMAAYYIIYTERL